VEQIVKAAQLLANRWAFFHDDREEKKSMQEKRERLLARLAAYDALAAAARIEVTRADRFGCRELRAALHALDGNGE
jgi:hypothetical protein